MYQAEGRDKGVFVCNMQWLCDWNALEIRGTVPEPIRKGHFQCVWTLGGCPLEHFLCSFSFPKDEETCWRTSGTSLPLTPETTAIVNKSHQDLRVHGGPHNAAPIEMMSSFLGTFLPEWHVSNT